MPAEHPASTLSGYGCAQRLRDAHNRPGQFLFGHAKSLEISNVNLVHSEDPATVPFLGTFGSDQVEESVYDGPDVPGGLRSPGKLDLVVGTAARILDRRAGMPAEARRRIGRTPSRTAAPDCRGGDLKASFGFCRRLVPCHVRELRLDHGPQVL